MAHLYLQYYMTEQRVTLYRLSWSTLLMLNTLSRRSVSLKELPARCRLVRNAPASSIDFIVFSRIVAIIMRWRLLRLRLRHFGKESSKNSPRRSRMGDIVISSSTRISTTSSTIGSNSSCFFFFLLSLSFRFASDYKKSNRKNWQRLFRTKT